jgi:hypothetical protein
VSSRDAIDGVRPTADGDEDDDVGGDGTRPSHGERMYRGERSYGDREVRR